MSYETSSNAQSEASKNKSEQDQGEVVGVDSAKQEISQIALELERESQEGYLSRISTLASNAWEEIKRTPGINFGAGMARGVYEDIEGVVSTVDTIRKASGLTFGEGSVERVQQSREELKAMGISIGMMVFHPIETFSVLAAERRNAYSESINQEGGITTGYELGRDYISIASLLTGKEAIEIGIAGAKKTVKNSAEEVAESTTRKVASREGEAIVDDTGSTDQPVALEVEEVLVNPHNEVNLPEYESSFRNVLSDSEFQAHWDRTSPLIKNDIFFIKESEILRNEELYTNSNPDISGAPSSFLVYSKFRNAGFTAEEMARLVLDKADITENLMEMVVSERYAIQALLNNPSNRIRLEKTLQNTRSFQEELGMGDAKTPIQFVGRIEKVILESSLDNHYEGVYKPNVPGILISIDQETKTLTDRHLRSMIHEYYHANSKVELENPGEGIQGHGSAERLKVGFLSRNRENRRRHTSFNSLNEGATEFLARIDAERQGLRVTHEFGEEPYDGAVTDTLALMQYLEGHRELYLWKENYGQALKPETLKKLVEFYTSETGTLTLGKEMSKKIGRFAPSLFDLLSSRGTGDFARFLKSNLDFKNGLIPETITISTKELESYSIDIQRIKDQFPFVEIKE